jgi:predicted amidohydrolase YtcJ
MQADIAVLSRDVFAIDAEELRSVQADFTLRDGAPIFDRHGAFA